MTLTLDFEKSFKVGAYLLTKGTLYVKYEPDLAKGREDMLQTGKRTDRLITKGRRAGPNYKYYMYVRGIHCFLIIRFLSKK